MKELNLIHKTVNTLLKSGHIDLFVADNKQNQLIKKKIIEELKLIYYGIGLAVLYKDCQFDNKIVQHLKDKYIKGIDAEKISAENQPKRRSSLYYGTLFTYFNTENLYKRNLTAASASFYILGEPM